MTTLGLLETDTLYDDLIPDYGSYGQMFAQFFNQLKSDGQADLKYRYYQVKQGQLPGLVDECDAYLITGSKAGVYDCDPWISLLQTWIVEFHQRGAKLIGICFGHQLLAHSLGGLAAKSDKGWGVGVHSTVLLSEEGRKVSQENTHHNYSKPTHLSLLYSHQDQVQKLPPSAQLLASSDFCPYAAFRMADQVLSYQGHPEFTPEYLQRLLLRRKQAIGKERYADAMASLTQATDEQKVGQQLLDFIYQQP